MPACGGGLGRADEDVIGQPLGQGDDPDGGLLRVEVRGEVALVPAARMLGDGRYRPDDTAAPGHGHPGRRRLDVPGAAAATLGVTALTLAITEAQHARWRSLVTPGALAAALLDPVVVVAVGGGLLNTPLTAAVTTGVTSAEAGAASGLMNTTKQVGAGIGLAALVTLAAALPMSGGGPPTGSNRSTVAPARSR